MNLERKVFKTRVLKIYKKTKRTQLKGKVRKEVVKKSLRSK